MPLTLTDQQRATLAFVAPFVAFVTAMSLERVFSLPAGVYYPLRLALVMSLLLLVSRPFVPLRPSRVTASVAIGAIVFAVWIGPDLLFNYRSSWLFENWLTGPAKSSIPPELRQNVFFAALRVFSCTLAVPLAEELFWRGWLVRWLVDKDFRKVPYRLYVPFAFWMVAVLFASEHGPYWEVGLVAGVVYNWWLIKTGNLADCVVAHSVTNGLLSVYVLATGQWQYWL